ncbi:MAG: Hsp20/alpha crystallin family protein [Minisyncoccia bacterium]|jgi:HSP20 family protein
MSEENHNDEPKRDIFVELAKLKTEPPSLRVSTEKPKAAKDEEGTLTVDVFEEGDYIVVQSTVAGVKEDDLEINITNESVTIRGERERKEEVKEKDYFYQELFWGNFSRSIILPQEVDPDNSTATMKNGILTIKMPKMSRSRSKKLKIKSDQ